MKPPKKRIGISFTRTKFEHYWNWFTAEDLGHDFELVLLSFEKGNVEDLHACDGFVLTGGVDVHPSRYGGETVYPNSPDAFEIERDHFESLIYRYSQVHHLPVLAICRGMQLINVLHGGRLIQDLGDGNSVHKKETEDDKTHSVKILEGSLLHEVSAGLLHETNSAHHQLVDPAAVGANLVANALSEDDSFIEGIEFKQKEGKPFLLGVQWHPERIEGKEIHPLSQNIKERFLAEVKNTNMQKLTVINPATEEVIGELNVDTTGSLTEKFDYLQKGKEKWKQKTLKERIDVLKSFAELLQKNTETLAPILTSEMGKPLQQARNEVAGACTRIKWLTENAGKYLSEEIMSEGDGLQEKIVYSTLR